MNNEQVKVCYSDVRSSDPHCSGLFVHLKCPVIFHYSDGGLKSVQNSRLFLSPVSPVFHFEELAKLPFNLRA